MGKKKKSPFETASYRGHICPCLLIFFKVRFSKCNQVTSTAIKDSAAVKQCVGRNCFGFHNPKGYISSPWQVVEGHQIENQRHKHMNSM